MARETGDERAGAGAAPPGTAADVTDEALAAVLRGRGDPVEEAGLRAARSEVLARADPRRPDLSGVPDAVVAYVELLEAQRSELLPHVVASARSAEATSGRAAHFLVLVDEGVYGPSGTWR